LTAIEAIAFMKEHRILQLKDGDLEITLAPDALQAPPANTKPSKEAARVEKMLDELGLTGMTRREQLDLFGQVFEGDFKKE
jgi:hypothetical protein